MVNISIYKNEDGTEYSITVSSFPFTKARTADGVPTPHLEGRYEIEEASDVVFIDRKIRSVLDTHVEHVDNQYSDAEDDCILCGHRIEPNEARHECVLFAGDTAVTTISAYHPGCAGPEEIWMISTYHDWRSRCAGGY